MSATSFRGIDVPGVRPPAGGFVHATVYRETNRTVRNEVLGDRRPALTVLVTDHWDEGWLIEIEVIATRPPAEAGPVS